MSNLQILILSELVEVVQSCLKFLHANQEVGPYLEFIEIAKYALGCTAFKLGTNLKILLNYCVAQCATGIPGFTLQFVWLVDQDE